MFTLLFYLMALVGLIVSFLADRKKTARALGKAWSALTGILPEFVTIILASGLILAFLSPDIIAALIGDRSGATGVLLASLAGSVVLMPGFVAFPLAALLLEKGAGILQIGAFVSALMMVGIITFPLERKTFGTRIAIKRNVLAWIFSLLVALVLRLVLGGSVTDGAIALLGRLV